VLHHLGLEREILATPDPLADRRVEEDSEGPPGIGFHLCDETAKYNQLPSTESAGARECHPLATPTAEDAGPLVRDLATAGDVQGVRGMPGQGQGSWCEQGLSLP
jgi:hypothetical protein